jgi:hypothetical protein
MVNKTVSGLKCFPSLISHYITNKVLFLFCRQQAVTGKLSQSEHWNTLTPLEQQQVVILPSVILRQ